MNFRSAAMCSLLLAGTLLLAACATTSHVVVGTVRPPIAPEQVKVYLKPPAQFERIALLESSSRNSLAFSAQGKTDKVIERMKLDAARLGANGILIQGLTDQATGSIGTGFGSAGFNGNTAVGVGLGSSITTYQKQGQGVAIYVIQE